MACASQKPEDASEEPENAHYSSCETSKANPADVTEQCRMFGKRVTLFKLFGFEVRVDASWLIIAVLVTWGLATGFFPRQYVGLTVSAYWWMGVSGAIGLFFRSFSMSSSTRWWTHAP
jgi:hypothetical protein